MKKRLVFMMILLIAFSSAVFAEKHVTRDARDSDVVRDAEPVLVRELSCIDRCLANGVGKEDCRRKCGIVAGTTDRRVDVEPVTRRDAVVTRPVIATRIDACLEKCVANGVEKDECRKKCSPRMGEEHAADIAKLRRAFAFNRDDFTKDELRKIAQLDRGHAKRIFEGADAAAVKEKISRLKIMRAEDLVKKRDVAVDKLERARKRYEKAKERFEALKGESEGKGKAFADIKAKLKECVDDCDALKEEVLARAKEHVAKSGERILNHIEKLLSKIEANDRIEEERAAELVAKLTDAAGSVTKALELADAATTKEELRAAAKEVASVWKNIKHVAKAGAARVVAAESKATIVRARQLEVKLEKLLAEIEEKGSSVDDLDALVKAFSGHVAQAKSLHEQSVEILDEVALKRGSDVADDEREGLGEMIRKAKDLHKQSQAALKEAHAVLVKISQGLREHDVTLEGVEEEELVEDESEEVEEDEE